MSQMRNWSPKVAPAKVSPSAARTTSARGPAQATTWLARTVVPPAQDTVTPSSSCSMPETWCDHRTSTSGWDAIASSSSSSVTHCEMFTNGGNGDRPPAARAQPDSAAGPGGGGGGRRARGDRGGGAGGGAGGCPGAAAAGDLGAGPDGVPDVQDVALLADRLAADQVARGAAVEDDAAHPPPAHQEGGGA